VQGATFVALTATDAWLTASELVSLLEQAGYLWPTEARDDPAQRLTHVLRQVHTLRDVQGRLVFASLEILGPDGRPVRVYKQEHLIGGPEPTS
jgi:hypothetical protein